MDVGLEERIRASLGHRDYASAATIAIRGYGPQIASYLRAVLRDEQDAADVFSQFCEFLWRSIGKYRGEAAFQTWAYELAWSAVCRFFADPYRQRTRRLSTTEMSELADEVFTTTRAETDRLAKLRSSLDPEEQTLLILRIDRGLPWKDITQVMAAAGTRVEEAALRKRYERLKERLRRLAREEGLLSRE
jgi:RNA polymerase sigma-70 factor (ECF subfamily)